MAKKKDTAHQRLIASAKKVLAAHHAVDPVPSYNAKAARLDAAGKRVRRAENQPTPEQEAKANYVEADVNEHLAGTKIKLGRAFQRQARFETIEGLTVPQLLALRRYRRAFDVSELSPVKSALDIGPGGGSGGPEAALSRIEAIAFADIGLRRIEAGVPAHLLPTLRAVALHDMDFKAAAQQRYGSTSGQRRDQVRREFLAGAGALIERTAVAVAPALPQPDPPAAPPADPIRPVPAAFLNEQGFMRPMSEIATIIREGHQDDADEAA